MTTDFENLICIYGGQAEKIVRPESKVIVKPPSSEKTQMTLPRCLRASHWRAEARLTSLCPSCWSYVPEREEEPMPTTR